MGGCGDAGSSGSSGSSGSVVGESMALVFNDRSFGSDSPSSSFSAASTLTGVLLTRAGTGLRTIIVKEILEKRLHFDFLLFFSNL